MKPRHKRIAIVFGVLALVGGAAGLVLNAFQSNLVFFYSPTQVAAQEAPLGKTFRLGGLVEAGSVKRDGLSVSFVVTDTVKATPVRYQGILPDLFKEGKGIASAAVSLTTLGPGCTGSWSIGVAPMAPGGPEITPGWWQTRRPWPGHRWRTPKSGIRSATRSTGPWSGFRPSNGRPFC